MKNIRKNESDEKKNKKNCVMWTLFKWEIIEKKKWKLQTDKINRRKKRKWKEKDQEIKIPLFKWKVCIFIHIFHWDLVSG